jgi:hypothetical protein
LIGIHIVKFIEGAISPVILQRVFDEIPNGMKQTILYRFFHSNPVALADMFYFDGNVVVIHIFS